MLKWEARHTHIGGSPLQFDGAGGSLFVKYLLLGLFTPLTLGIYAIFWPVIYKKWEVQNTEAVYQTQKIQSQAKAHEAEAIKDYAKFHIAAAEQEISAIRSGYTGNEDPDTLERLAQSGNPFACSRLAAILKGDSPRYEGRALALLQTAANNKIHSALYALAIQLPQEQSIPMLAEAARCGNPEASWLLAEHYMQSGDLYSAAYWFRLAIEWERPEAVSRTDDYNRLVKEIALRLSESQQPPKKTSRKVAAIILGVIGGLIVLTLIGCAVSWLIGQIGSMDGTGSRIPSFNSGSHEAISPGRNQAGVVMTDANVAGLEYKGTTGSGKDIHYVYGSRACFDRDNLVLHLNFGLIAYDGKYVQVGRNGWKTEPIYPDCGFTAIYLDTREKLDEGQLELEIYDSKTDDVIGWFTTELSVGDADDTEARLSGEDISSGGEDSPAGGDYAQAAANSWCLISYADDYLVVTIRTLYDDGTAEETASVYTPVYDEYGWTDFYYDGMRWCRQWGDDRFRTGTYTLSDNSVIFLFDGAQEEYELSQIDGRQYLGGEYGWVKASPIAGTWTTAKLETYSDDSSMTSETTLDVTYLTIEPSGVFRCYETFYIWLGDGNTDAYGYCTPVEGTSWGNPAMGVPEMCGTFELRETELQLHCLWDSVGNQYDEYVTAQAVYQPDGTLLVDGVTYYPGSYTIPELCALIGCPVN